jgi:DNA-binding transcriptional MocR family regulator
LGTAIDNRTKGCTVTQDNKELVTGLGLASNTQISSLSAIFTTALLSSPTLPFLITLNSARLAESYILITSFFVRYRIRYIPVNAGLTIFARLAPAAKTWDDESRMVQKLKNAGVLVSAGRTYHGVQKEKGWARLSFSIEQSRLREALRRIEIALDLE